MTTAHVAHRRQSPVAEVMLRLIKAYQLGRSGRLSPCRFSPSCSQYALDAIESHGACGGGWLATRRLLRCHPWGGHGWDPVPDRKVD